MQFFFPPTNCFDLFPTVQEKNDKGSIAGAISPSPSMITESLQLKSGEDAFRRFVFCKNAAALQHASVAGRSLLSVEAEESLL